MTSKRYPVGKTLGFAEFDREAPKRVSATLRTQNWREIFERWPESDSRTQGARCMDCAVPFCHGGCPLGNLIPDWNHHVYTGNWEQALRALDQTNNFPEFTGRICPAPCEASCVLAINDDPVTIEYIEKAIADHGFEQDWITPRPPERRTGKKIAVVGSGPAGLAAAAQLNEAGHSVTVFERDEVIGGILSLGIPEFKLEKSVVQRRVKLMAAGGVEFRTGVNVGLDLSASELQENYDAVVLAGGATAARDLPIPGRELQGIHQAMDYLPQQNRILKGDDIPAEERISAEGKRVVILGGGDTGADCLGTAHRQGAETVHQVELLPRPPDDRNENNPWPVWPTIFRTSAAHEEGGGREYSILTKSFSGENGVLKRLHAVRLEWGAPHETGRPSMIEVEGSEFEIETDLVLLAMGFLGPEQPGLLTNLGIAFAPRGNVNTDATRMTNVPGVFSAGDMARGQSLVVWAIAEGRDVAHHVDKYLRGATDLPPVPGGVIV